MSAIFTPVEDHEERGRHALRSWSGVECSLRHHSRRSFQRGSTPQPRLRTGGLHLCVLARVAYGEQGCRRPGPVFTPPALSFGVRLGAWPLMNTDHDPPRRSTLRVPAGAFGLGSVLAPVLGRVSSPRLMHADSRKHPPDRKLGKAPWRTHHQFAISVTGAPRAGAGTHPVRGGRTGDRWPTLRAPACAGCLVDKLADSCTASLRCTPVGLWRVLRSIPERFLGNLPQGLSCRTCCALTYISRLTTVGRAP